MKNFVFKIIAVIIGTILLLSTISVAATKQDLNNVNNKINEAEEKLDDVKEEKSSVMEEVEKLTTQINGYQSQIDELDNQIAGLNTKIEESQKKLEEAQANYNKQDEDLNARLVATYESGDTSYLDFLLSSSNIVDLISNYYLVSEIATSDTELLNEIEKQKQEIEQAKTTLETSKQELATSKASKQSVATQLQSAKSEKDAQVSKLSQEEQTIQKQIDELEAQSKKIEQQIRASETQYQKQVQQVNGGAAPNGKFGWPVPGYYYITSYYGMRFHPILHVNRMHTGIDIGNAPYGANFCAVADGVVTSAGVNGGYGNTVIINHGGGISSLYAHASSILVSAGQTVTRGTPVSRVGSTGMSTGVHAHFEIRINGVTTDPLPYIQ